MVQETASFSPMLIGRLALLVVTTVPCRRNPLGLSVSLKACLGLTRSSGKKGRPVLQLASPPTTTEEVIVQRSTMEHLKALFQTVAHQAKGE